MHHAAMNCTFCCITLERSSILFSAHPSRPSRSSQVLEDLLTTECEAVLGHDCFSAYRAYMEKAPVTVQFCVAHLIRELRFVSESTNVYIAAYGQRLLDQLKCLFRLIHRRDQLAPDTFQRRLEQIRDDFLQKARRTKAGGAAATLAKRFRIYGRDYFTFITCPDIEPTYNGEVTVRIVKGKGMREDQQP